mmetsp:Transcript_53294/g.165297  ORF Transcript_53294/g.165297 Transcript_53294/m.165297 type:complete len:236 (-) Transcript_53294:933-1640(-)
MSRSRLRDRVRTGRRTVCAPGFDLAFIHSISACARSKGSFWKTSFRMSRRVSMWQLAMLEKGMPLLSKCTSTRSHGDSCGWATTGSGVQACGAREPTTGVDGCCMPIGTCDMPICDGMYAHCTPGCFMATIIPGCVPGGCCVAPISPGCEPGCIGTCTPGCPRCCATSATCEAGGWLGVHAHWAPGCCTGMGSARGAASCVGICEHGAPCCSAGDATGRPAALGSCVDIGPWVAG